MRLVIKKKHRHFLDQASLMTWGVINNGRFLMLIENFKY